jgi:phage baseplate assembly protein gpV
VLFKFGDVDEYYWTTIFREPGIRRLENVIYAFSNLKSGLTEFDKNTSYWLQVDTIHKKVHLHTDNKGEVIQIDAKNNKVDVTTSKEANITAPTINLNGNVNIGGHLKVSGGSSLYGGNTIPDYCHC